MAPNEKLALALAPTITIVLMLFGGFYVNTSTIPAVLRWSEQGAGHRGGRRCKQSACLVCVLGVCQPQPCLPPTPCAVRFISHLYWAYMVGRSAARRSGRAPLLVPELP